MKYIITQPNSQGRLGHQFHNWSLGLVLTKICDVQFIHTPFYGKSQKWETVFNFGRKFNHVPNISNKIQLPPIDLGHNPLFDINKAKENLNVWVNIINNSPDNTLFITPHDMFPGFLSEKIIEFAPYLKKCYWGDKTKYEFDGSYHNIGLHIRRGDITKTGNTNRWIELSDYKKLMERLRKIDYDKPIKFHIFSEGKQTYFEEIENEDVIYHLDGSDIEAFRKLASIDTLVTGLSTFSILAAYLSDNQIIYHKLMNFTRWENIDNFTDVNYYYDNIKLKI
jgi:hypothetical protein